MSKLSAGNIRKCHMFNSEASYCIVEFDTDNKDIKHKFGEIIKFYCIYDEVITGIVTEYNGILQLYQERSDVDTLKMCEKMLEEIDVKVKKIIMIGHYDNWFILDFSYLQVLDDYLRTHPNV